MCQLRLLRPPKEEQREIAFLPELHVDTISHFCPVHIRKRTVNICLNPRYDIAVQGRMKFEPIVIWNAV